jgi:hypothetical protein
MSDAGDVEIAGRGDPDDPRLTADDNDFMTGAQATAQVATTAGYQRTRGEDTRAAEQAPMGAAANEDGVGQVETTDESR